MALIVSGIATLLGQWSPLIQVAIAGSAGVLVYALLALILRIEAATFLFQIIRVRLHRSGREVR
jgi:putative peptidoglycan lipid II flippase